MGTPPLRKVKDRLASLLCIFPTCSPDGAAELSTKETETPPNDCTTNVALAPLKDDTEENLSTSMTSDDPNSLPSLEPTVSPEQEGALMLPSHPASAIGSGILTMASQENQGHSPEAQQAGYHPEESANIGNQPVSSTSEGSPAHNEAETFLSPAPHVFPEGQVECNVPNPMTSQTIAEEQAMPSIQLADVIPVDPEDDISEDEEQVARLYLVEARTSYAEFKAGGIPGCLDLAISWYQSALELIPTRHADWIMVAMEKAGALEDSQRINNGMEGTTSPLEEAIKIYEQVLCFTSDDDVVSRLSHVLRLRYELKKRRDSSGPVRKEDVEEDTVPDHGNRGVDEDISEDDTNDLSVVYLSSAREHLSTFRAESHPTSLDLAISSYRVAARLLPRTHPDWPVASLELSDALQAMHVTLSDEPCGSHLGEAIEVCEQVIAFSSEHSGDHTRAASRLCHALQLRHEVERDYGDLPKSAHAEVEEHDNLSNMMGVDNLEEEHPPLGDGERAELAVFYLDAARDTFLTYRAGGYKESVDLQSAISSYRSAVSLMAPTEPSWVAACLELGDALEEMTNKDFSPPNCSVYREEAIGIYKHVLHALPHGDENRKEVILCFSWAVAVLSPVGGLQVFKTLVLRFIVLRAANDYFAFRGNQDLRLLDRLIFWFRKVQHQMVGQPSHLLMVALFERYQADATPDARLLEEALQMGDPARLGDDQPLGLPINTLTQIGLTVAESQLQREVSIRLLRMTLDAAQRITGELSPASHLQQFAEIRRSLAYLLVQSNSQRNRDQAKHGTPCHVDDVDEAIIHQTEVLRLLKVLDHPGRAHATGMLALIINDRREATPYPLPYSDQEIELLHEAVFECEIHRPFCHIFVAPFLQCISHKAIETNDPDEFMTHYDEISALLRPGDMDGMFAPGLFDKIGIIKRELEGRYRHVGGRSDPLRAWSKKELQQMADSACGTSMEDGPGGTTTPLSFSEARGIGLAVANLSARYSETGESDLRDKAGALLRRLEESTRGRNDGLGDLFTYLVPYLRAQLVHDPFSRDAASIRVLEAEIEASDKELPPHRIRIVLAELLRRRLRDPEENLRDLKRRKPLLFQTLRPALPNDDPNNWRLRLTILKAHAEGRGFAGNFKDELHELGFENLDSLVEAIQGTLTQLHHHAQLSPNIRASLQTIQSEGNAASSLSSFVLLAPLCEPQDDWETHIRLSEVALTTLEELRTIVWTQATRRRHPADQVAEVAPELANKFRELSNVLDNPIQNRGHLHDFIHPNSSRSVEASSSATVASLKKLPPLITRGNVQREWDDVVAQIRCIPGFEDFLGLKSFRGLLQVASEGPVVVLAATSGLPFSVAIIIDIDNREDNVEGDKRKGKGSQTTLDYRYIPLKIGREELKSLRQRLKVSLGFRNRRVSSLPNPPDIDGKLRADANTSNASPAEGMLGGAESIRAGKRKKKDESVESVLSTLWTKVAQPVVEWLTEMQKPDISHRRRIWWCPTGPFAFMPIHAAGTEDGMFHVSDFFISSYTPTLTSLIQARERPIPAPESTKVLAAIQPNPGNGWSPLPYTKAELEQVHKLVSPQHLISLSSPPAHPDSVPSMLECATRDIDLEGVHTTCANIFSHLPTTSVLHLACHGHQNKLNPLLNGFVLRDGEELTVEMLMKSQEEPGSGGRCVAVLSACDTAALDEKQPDEMINLANAMLFVGFRSVLATMWPMADPDGPDIARAIYSELFRPEVGGDLSKFCVATVLDRVMRDMREADYPWERWATFIHIGA